MLMLKSLTALEQFRLRVANKPEIVEDEIAENIICFSVMKGIGNADTYSDDFTREARGICFNKVEGYVMSRPYHKFFNLNERESTLAHNLKWKDVVRVMDKRDGSMIHPVMRRVNGVFKPVFKSKKTFESDVALNAQAWVEGNSANQKYLDFCKTMLMNFHATPIFEWTSPNDRIVLGYNEPSLKLCHIRANDSGHYWPLSRVRQAAIWLRGRGYVEGVPMVDEVTEFTSFSEMLEAAETRENVEGWVIQFASGEMVKVKTQWYMARHRAMTNYRERDVVEDIMNEKLDDVKSALVTADIDIEPILRIEERFASDMRLIMACTESLYDEHKNLPARDVAARLMGHNYRGLVLAMYNKKQPKYLDFFRANFWKQKYSLDSIAQLMGRPVEEDDSQS